MADAIGLAASVAGLVSLGLQVAGGIGSYIDGVKARKEELAAVSTSVRHLQSSIDVLQNARPGLSASNQAASSAATSAMKACKEELEAMVEFLHGLLDFPGQEQGFTNSVRQQKKKLSYPFHRQSLNSLEHRLDIANNVLQTAIQALGLTIVSCIDNTVSVVNSKVDRSNENILVLVSESKATNTSISAMQASLHTSNTMAASIQQDLHTVLPQKQDFRDLMRVNQRTIDSVVTGSEKTEQQYNILKTTLSALSTDTTRHSELERASMRRIEAKLDQIIEAKVLDVLGGQSGSELAHRQLTSSQIAVGRLVAVPSDLKRICDQSRDHAEDQGNTATAGAIATNERSELNASSYQAADRWKWRGCLCSRRTSSQRRQINLGDISLATEVTTYCKHLPGCRLARHAPVSKSQSIQLSYSGLQRLLSTAIDLSFSLKTGAGGFSMSPTITLRSVVDRDTSPAFRAMALLHDCLHTSLSTEDHEQFAELVVQRTIRLYESRRSSPRDTDIEGKTVLHHWAFTLHCSTILESSVFRNNNYIEHNDSILARYTQQLLDAGVEASLRDSRGWLPLRYIILGTSVQSDSSYLPALTSTLVYATEEPYYSTHDTTPLSVQRSVDMIIHMEQSTECAEVLCCGLLSMAILRRNVEKVRALLQRCPSLLQERNLLGQTPFRLAVPNPDILKILIDSDDKAYMYSDKCVFDCAIHFSGRICLNGTSWKACSNCPCLRSFKVLQAHGYCYHFKKFFFLEHFVHASHSCRLAAIETLKQPRERLKDIARRNLSPADIRHYKLDAPQVLDYWASEVVDILDRKDISIPASLRAEFEMVGIQSQCSVYHWLADCFCNDSVHRMAECFYQHGFLDIDHANTKGHTPLSLCAYDHCYQDFNYIPWLFRHGADISKPMPGLTSRKDNVKYNSHITIAHIISLQWLDRWGPGRVPSEMVAFQQLFTMMASLRVHDHCRCGCVGKGCHTLKSFFTTVWKNSRAGDLSGTGFPSHEVAARLSHKLQQISLDFSQWEHACISALRIFTFETLELRHTCCKLNLGARYSPEEVSDVQDEDRERLDLLEELMGVFTEEYRRRGLELTEFLTTFWAARMAEVQAEMEAARLTEEDRRDAERLGVRWDTSEDEEVEDRSSLEYWVKRLDEIAPV